jgi:hypothetical protein
LNFGDTDVGLEEASQAVRADTPSSAACSLVLGVAKREAGDYKGAKKALAKAEISVYGATSLLMS